MRQSLLITAAATALAAGLSGAQAMPITPSAGVRPAGMLEQVQYWGGWGPRYYYRAEPRFYEPPVYAPQPRYIEPEDRIAGHEAATIARSMGYRPISAPSFGNGAWAIEGLDREGLRVRVIIDAQTGRPIRVRYIERANGGQRFGTPPVWPDERPSFYPHNGRQPGPQRDSALDPDWDRPSQVERPARPVKPERERTARAVPVPRPRPSIEAPVEPRPQVIPPNDLPPAAVAPVPQPPAASLAPAAPLGGERLVPTPRIVTPPPSTPPLSVEPEQPTAALPTRPDPEPPTIATPPVVPDVAPQAAPMEPQPAPSAALPSTPAVTEPQPPLPQPPAAAPEPPMATAPAPAEPQAAAKPDEGVMVDGRFLGPNGETLPGAPSDRPAVRRVTP